jgi:hypothetical protein
MKSSRLTMDGCGIGSDDDDDEKPLLLFMSMEASTVRRRSVGLLLAAVLEAL